MRIPRLAGAALAAGALVLSLTGTATASTVACDTGTCDDTPSTGHHHGPVGLPTHPGHVCPGAELHLLGVGAHLGDCPPLPHPSHPVGHPHPIHLPPVVSIPGDSTDCGCQQAPVTLVPPPPEQPAPVTVVEQPAPQPVTVPAPQTVVEQPAPVVEQPAPAPQEETAPAPVYTAPEAPVGATDTGDGSLAFAR